MKGQCFVFFLAGYETTSTAMTLLINLLAQHPEVQEKIRAEVDQVFSNKVQLRTSEATLVLRFSKVFRIPRIP